MKLYKKIINVIGIFTIVTSFILTGLYMYTIYGNDTLRSMPEYIDLINKIKFISIVGVVILILNNLFIYRFIFNLIVKRLVKVINGVEDMLSNNKKDFIMDLDNYDDEITCLTKDINAILYKIKSTSNTLNRNELKYSKLLSSINIGYIYLRMNIEDNNKKYCVLEVNEAARTLLDIDEVIVVNKLLDEIITKKMYSILTGHIKDINKEKNIIAVEELNLREDLWIKLSAYSLEEGYISVLLDNISKIKLVSEEMTYMATFDTLTGLWNRRKVTNYINELIEKNKPFELAFFDIDNFKSMNDTLGHDFGDETLILVANILRENLMDCVKVARLGGDEFVIIMEDSKIKNYIYLEKIMKSLNREIVSNSFTFELKVSVGVSSFPEDSRDFNNILKYADIAMYKSKTSGGNCFKVFTEDMLIDIKIENSLKKSIKRDELKVLFQPIYSIDTSKITGAEALVRWYCDNEIIMPDSFIYMAKKNGFIVEIDKFVLKESCKLCKYHVDRGNRDFSISVNISNKTLRQERFISYLFKLIDIYGIEPHNIKIEITEDEIIEDYEKTSILLNELKRRGIKICLDDFGTGYSSFNYIKSLPLDIVKIDRTLLIKIEEEDMALAIVDSVLKLCQMLNLVVICEGVETKTQLDILTNIECNYVQGYYINRALVIEDFNKFIYEFNNVKDKSLVR